MKEEFLPIGSIITVANQDLMICSYFKKGSLINNNQYDYACCLYPYGINEKAALVKKSDIQRVKFIGFLDSKFLELKKQLEDKNE